MNTIKLTQAQLENLIYEIASSASEIEETSEEFNVLFTKGAEMAYPVYKKEYGEEPDIDFDPEFASIISQFLTKLLYEFYDEFFIDEVIDEDSTCLVNAACFYSSKSDVHYILIKDVSNVVYL